MTRRLVLAGALIAALLAGPSPAQQPSAEERLRRSLDTLQVQRPGVVDAYVVTVALDSDPVFNREAREAGRVLAKRFDAAGRTIVLAADEGTDEAAGPGSPLTLQLALAKAAELMDRREDVLVLYSTSHGTPRAGLNYRNGSQDSSVITPADLAAMLSSTAMENRLVILQACYSGQFIPALAAPRTVVATAASATRSSFGCSAGNDWTFFGHALINQAMRQPDGFVRQFRKAFVTIYGWERKLGFPTSDPQISVGKDAGAWLAELDSRASKAAGVPVGKPPSELQQ